MDSSIQQVLPCSSRPPCSRRKRGAQITFAVVGRNEAVTLARALQAAQDAASPGDEVIFVDSSSEDDSLRVAQSTGVRAVRAPAGKGRAMACALAETTTPYICFIDADIYGSSRNIPAALGEAVRRSRPDMVVGSFEDEQGGVPSVTLGVYEPLVRALFPEAAGKYAKKPLSGFRALRTGHPLGQLPPGFGIEAHLNIASALRPCARIETVDLGLYRGRFLYKPRMGDAVGRAVLDLAQAHGRLEPKLRPAWDAWLTTVTDHIATYTGDVESREAFRTSLLELTARALPPAH